MTERNHTNSTNEIFGNILTLKFINAKASTETSANPVAFEFTKKNKKSGIQVLITQIPHEYD